MIIPINNQYSYDTMPRNKDLGYVIKNHCDKPSKTLLIDWKGDCFLCDCEAWLPISVGKITDFDSLEQIWNNDTAISLQKDIAGKKYSHCAVESCGILDNDILFPHYTVSINIDESCNLWCPSCRKQKTMITSGPEYEKKLAWSKHIVKLLESFEHPTKIIMSGNGDVMASNIMRPLIHNFQPKSNHKIKLFTNGLLLRKQLENNPVLNHIDDYLLSIDAGSKDVYEKVRLGGRWDILLDNFDFLKDHARLCGAQVSLTFVVQSANHHDMINFANLCLQYGFDGGFTKLNDWGTWKYFNEQDVIGNISHPNHDQAIENLKNVYQRYHGKIHFDSALSRLSES